MEEDTPVEVQHLRRLATGEDLPEYVDLAMRTTDWHVSHELLFSK